MTEASKFPSPDTAMTARRLWIVRGAALTSMGTFFLASLPELMAGRPYVLLATLPFQVPYLFVLGRLWKGPQKKGLALALGVGITLGGAALLLGLVAASEGGWPILAILLVFALVQGTLIVNAGRAYRALGHERGNWRIMARGFVEPLIYFAVFALPIALSIPTFVAGEKKKHTRPVVEWMEKVHHCAEVYASAHPELGFPMRLDLLGPAGSNCISREPEAGAKGKYSVLYVPRTPDAGGRIATYTLQASPPEKSLPRFSMNESGVVQSVD